jgi:hypothetical protein
MAGGLFAAASVLLAGAASAQSVDCPAGARGGAGGNAGRSVGGNGGLGFTVGGFATGGGSVNAGGGTGGSARGGAGGRGGSGTLPICNQNTNGVVRGAPPVAVPVAPVAPVAPHAAAPAAYPAAGMGGGGRVGGVGGGLARTGAHTTAEVGLAGVGLIAGGLLLFFGQPVRRVRAGA